MLSLGYRWTTRLENTLIIIKHVKLYIFIIIKIVFLKYNFSCKSSMNNVQVLSFQKIYK